MWVNKTLIPETLVYIDPNLESNRWMMNDRPSEDMNEGVQILVIQQDVEPKCSLIRPSRKFLRFGSGVMCG